MFAYCRNNPVSRIDISGREDLEIYLDDGSDGDVHFEPIDPKDAAPSAQSTPPVGQSGGSGPSGGHSPAPGGGSAIVDGNPKGEKTEVHHIVEQCQATKSGFSRANIDGASNKVRIPQSVHRKISGYYSSKPAEYGGLRVRDWLAGQSFEFQFQYGMKILEQMWLEVFGE